MATITASKAVQHTPVQPLPKTGRLVSLDIFRGLTIAGMILVNNSGDWNHVYWPLEHAAWNGWTPTDLIFPFFLFIVGVSMVMSFEARRAKGASRGALLKHVVRRAVIIYAIGFFLYAFPEFNLHTVRLMGVLQRIALVYLLAGTLVLYTGKKTWAWVTGALLVGYWLLMTRIPGFDLTMDGNLAGWIDRHVMYEHLYIAHRWDPEGLLHTLPAIGTCLLGVFTGVWLRGARDGGRGARNIGLMLAAGIAGIAAGELWGLVFPINKNMWTSSYVLFTAGAGLVLLSAIQWLTEKSSRRTAHANVGDSATTLPKAVRSEHPHGPWWGRPFVWYGSNAITVYAASSFAGTCSVKFHTTWQGKQVMWKTYLYERFFAPLASPVHASLLWALAYVITFWILAWIMYRKAIFIKI